MLYQSRRVRMRWLSTGRRPLCHLLDPGALVLRLHVGQQAHLGDWLRRRCKAIPVVVLQRLERCELRPTPKGLGTKRIEEVENRIVV